MGLSIFDIAKGISWTDEGRTFLLQKNEADTSWLIIEYLNDSSENDLKNDLKTLETFETVIGSNDKKKIENHIINELIGFMDYGEDILAHVAGATDQSPSILYDFENNSFLLIHPNLITEGKYHISLRDLLGLIEKKIHLNKILSNLKLGKN